MSGERERRIMEVASRHFAKFGYKKTVVDEIVREVGIAKGTFYLHFKSKKELLSRVIGAIQAETQEQFQQLMQKTAGQPAEQVREMVRFSLDVMVEYPLLAKLAADEAETHFFRDMLDLPERREEEKATVAFVQGILQQGIEQGVFREDVDLKVMPYLLGSLKTIYFYREFLVGEDMLTIRELIDGLADMAVRSLMK